MSNERVFFEKMVNSMADGWNIKIADHVQPGEVFGANHEVRFYLVDTSKDWVFAGASSQSNFKALANDPVVLGMDTKTVMDFAASGLVEFSDGRIHPDSSEMVVRYVAAALARTQTFVRIEDMGKGLAGHWLFVAYRLQDGCINTRPLFVPARTNQQFLPPGDLDDVIASIVRMDCDPNGNTEVSRMIRSAGGARLDAKWSNLW